MSSEPAAVVSGAPPEEPLGQRVLRQARTGQLDEDRLLPGQDAGERLEEFEAGIRHALEHPAPLQQRQEGQ